MKHPAARLPAAPSKAHQWVSFEDPSEYRTWVFDVTFLLSGWHCIFGAGCQGVLTEDATERMEGCCSYGAHYIDEQDEANVTAAARRLSAKDWQFRAEGRSPAGVSEEVEGARQTRLVEDACIFLNRPGFPGGAGCAFHLHAMRKGLPPASVKPEVCWQLPLRRDELVGPDGHVTSTIGQWERRHWGEGGADFHWWCTEDPAAFGASQPVWRSLEDELVRMTSREVYDLLAAYLSGLEKSATTPLPHPVVRKKA